MELVKPDPGRLPAAVREVSARLRAAGARAWLVGGPVRDLLLGQQPVDWDLATTLPPARFPDVLPDGDLRDARLGTVRLQVQDLPLVVTTLREEGGYRDHRHPDAVAFVADPARDAVRRDFTINALYLDPDSGELLDPVGGVADLAASTLRTIGDPGRRFAEDPLRLLRAVRFAARMDLALAPATAAAVAATAPRAATLSAERVYAELTAACTSRGRGRALQLLVDLGLAAVLLPEVAAMAGVTQPPEYHPEGCVLTHVCLVLDHVPAGDPVLAWAALLHDVGKPPTWRLAEDRIRFDGHDTLSARMATAILERLRAPRDLIEAVAAICRDHIRFAALPGMRPRRRERWMREPLFARHLAFHRADCLGSHGKLDIWQMADAAWRALPPAAPPLVTGADVLALGVPSGPRVGALLRQLEQLVDERPVPTSRDEALVLLQDLVAAGRKGAPGAGR